MTCPSPAGSAGLLESLALVDEAREEFPPRRDERAGAITLQLPGERVDVDAGAPEALEQILGIAAVGGQHRADLAVVGEREQRLLGHRVHRMRRRERLYVENIRSLRILGPRA